MKPQARS